MSHRKIASGSRRAVFTCLPPRGLFLCLALAAVIPLAGCRHLKGSAAAATPATVAIQLDKAAYRPGEAVVITAKLNNTSGKALKLRALDALSVAFYFSREGTPEPMQREAVCSRSEALGRMIELPAGQSVERQFLLTRLTYYSGPLKITAIYDPNSPETRMAGGKLIPKVTSNDVRYTVGGERLFAREPSSGLITQANAGRLACEKATASGLNGAEAAGIKAVTDEYGFDKWYVNVTAPGGALTGWLVNPYTGVVNRANAPFDPKSLSDPRRLRPNAPRQPPQAND